MRHLDWSALNAGERKAALARPAQRTEARVRDVVRRIFDEVEAEGEAAVARWSEQLDGAAPVRVDVAQAMKAAEPNIDPADLDALRFAAGNVRRFHQETAPAPGPKVETVAGVACQRVWRPIRSAGLYAPGGTAPLFSTILMLAIPAEVARVPQRVAVTPPSRSGPHPMMIAAAALSGLEELWLVGGAQAIAALTFGVGLPKADKLFGPGNAFVAEAKRYAAELPGGPGIDLPAGPSELLVIADAQADPRLVAADLLSQAEHDREAQVIFVTPDAALVEKVAAEVERQTASLPRAAIARDALNHAATILVRSLDEAAEVSNLYAPEHLSLQVRDPDRLVEQISSAGAVFMGDYAAETFGDYVAGPSHVLPTDGAARCWDGLGVSSFMTSFTVQQVTRAGAGAMAASAARLARLEGLEAHARAADFRAEQA
jgi:histidinol dehydrogenase